MSDAEDVFNVQVAISQYFQPVQQFFGFITKKSKTLDVDYPDLESDSRIGVNDFNHVEGHCVLRVEQSYPGGVSRDWIQVSVDAVDHIVLSNPLCVYHEVFKNKTNLVFFDIDGNDLCLQLSDVESAIVQTLQSMVGTIKYEFRVASR